jgi:dolichol kinase
MIFEYIRIYLLNTAKTNTNNADNTTVDENINNNNSLTTSITTYLSHFVHRDEEKDRSGYTLSHISLLIGCGVTVILSELVQDTQDVTQTKGSENYLKFSPIQRIALQLLPYLGLIAIGVGDSLASVCGSLYGRIKWSELNKKTVFGSFTAFVGMVFTSCLILLCEVWMHSEVVEFYALVYSYANSLKILLVIVVTMFLTALLEAFTCENDNIILPLYSALVYILLVLFML